MRLVSLTALTAIALISPARADERIDKLFESWQRIQREMKSLTVAFEARQDDDLARTQHHYVGTAKLVRGKEGVFSGSYDVARKDSPDPNRGDSYLLCKGAPYLLQHARKTAYLSSSTDGVLLRDVQLYVTPIALLVDRNRAEKEFKLEITSTDEWYTYMRITPKKLRTQPWFRINFDHLDIAFINKPSATIPKDMPSQFRLSCGAMESVLYDIKSWRFNDPDGPKESDFPAPTDRPGWQVIKFDGK
jgi:hypothetical protein